MDNSTILKVKLNAANLLVAGNKNPNWKGGKVSKLCLQCGNAYNTRPGYTHSKYCSMKCVGLSQKGSKKAGELRLTEKSCEICNKKYSVPTSHAKRYRCCSKECSFKLRSLITKGSKNISWNGGVSRLPYPYDWAKISLEIRERDGHMCRNPKCTNVTGKGKIEAHHIDYDKMNCSPSNLITLCTVCNTKANFNRNKHQQHYKNLVFEMYGY